MLDRVRAFEEREFAGVSRTDKLRPLNETGATDLLRAQIGRLEQENAQLRERLRGAEVSLCSLVSKPSVVLSIEGYSVHCTVNNESVNTV